MPCLPSPLIPLPWERDFLNPICEVIPLRLWEKGSGDEGRKASSTNYDHLSIKYVRDSISIMNISFFHFLIDLAHDLR